MPELTLRLLRDQNGFEGSVEPNACDGGRTETAFISFEDEQGLGVSGTVSVQISKEPVPHTDDVRRSIDFNTLSVEVDGGDGFSSSRCEAVLHENVDLKSAFHQLCQQCAQTF